ncbi:MAG: ATP-binding cassette domain-containing protein, partial [Candidatus Rokubacteria bacterium]|nr:ATP-binding cassette domain-containing protein [Candidatus Rokubacteria bacterium]
MVLRDLAKTFVEGPREVAAVSRVSFEVGDKEFVALVGPSGCGKSTVLRLAAGLESPDAGRIT